MKKRLNFLNWILVLAGVISLPFFLRKKNKKTEEQKNNIRYDNSDYIGE